MAPSLKYYKLNTTHFLRLFSHSTLCLLPYFTKKQCQPSFLLAYFKGVLMWKLSSVALDRI